MTWTQDPVLAVITRLKADTAIQAVVGASPNQRIYRALLPKVPTFPAVTVFRSSNIRTNESTTGKYAKSRIQCTSWAELDATADNLSELIADSLNTVTNTYLAPGVHVVGIFDAGAVPDNNPELSLWMYHRDFVIEYAYA